MVTGIDTFREKFKDYTDCYTVIGGAACDIIMSQANFDFRATKDIDMILIIEDRYPEFGKVFWEYIKEAGYKCGSRNSEDMHFYRFTDPKAGYPVMIELFSKKPGYKLEVDEGIIPIHMDEDTSSLSAILLNDDFYNFMLQGRAVVDGISVLRAEYLMPFKMFAWLDLKNKKQNGEHVDSRDIKKHKYDVFRLLQIVDSNTIIPTDGLVKKSINEFFEEILKETLPLSQLGLLFNQEEAMGILHDLYGI